MDIENNQEMEFPIKCLVIKDFSENYIRYDLVHSSLAQDLYSFINKLPMECFFQNYRLEVEKTGKRLNYDDNLYALEMKDFDIVRMVPTLYDPTSAKEHFETIKYILNEHPFFVGAELQHLQDMVFRDYDKLVETSTKIYSKLNGGTPFPFYNYLMEDNIPGDDDEGKETDVSAEKEKIEKNEKTENKKSDKDKKKDEKTEKVEQKVEDTEKAKKKNDKKSPSLEEVKQQMLDLDYKRLNLTNIPNSFIAETKNKPIKYRCLNAIYLSSFNYKIDSNEAPKGDLLYMEVVTLENRHLFITNSEKGFFVSKCQQHIYDPTPADNICSYTLPGLLSLVSPTFKENFAKTLSQNIHGDDFMFLPSPFDKFDWIVPVENPFSYNYRFKSFINEKDQVLLLNKEWNEEYQGILDIKQIEGMNLETREKLLVPFYNNFKSIALQGARLIANKKIKPFSMSESPASGYYIYGNIFITVLQDSGDFTTIYGANLDLRHINYLNKHRYEFGLSNIYFGLCCIVSYKGMVLHAQVMTPGIIFNSEHLIVYGEYDDGKIRKDEEFQKEIEPVMEKLGIVSNDINNEDMTVDFTNYLGHPEIKGVRGVDKRRYLFDLVHLFPRDLNFEDIGVIIRPELVHEYRGKIVNESLNSPEVAEKMKKIQSEMDAIAKTAKDQKEMAKLLEKPFEEREAFYTELENDAKEKVKLNTVYKTDFTAKTPKEEDVKSLENMAKYLKEELIPRLLKESQNEEENLPCDSETLKSFLHKKGISSIYLGEIVSIIENDSALNKSLCWLKSVILREVLVKSARSIFNQILKTVPQMFANSFSAYFLNVFLGHPNQIKALDYFTLNLIGNNSTFRFSKPEVLSKTNSGENLIKDNKQNSKENDKKKKKKRRNKTGQQEINVDFKYFLTENLVGGNVTGLLECCENGIFIKPTEIWEKIVKYANGRYRTNLKFSNAFDLVDFNYNKIGMLRDFCRKVGLSLEANDYHIVLDFNFVKTDVLKPDQLPFSPENIIDFFPVVKEYNLPSEILKPSFSMAEALFNQGNLHTAAEKYKQVIVLCHEIHGPIHRLSAVCHRKLSSIAYIEKDYDTAITYMTKAIITYEKCSEFDSSHTANCYSELSTYYYSIGDILSSFKSMYKAWEITLAVYPRNHPEVANKILALSYFFIDIECVSNALELAESSMKISLNFNEEDNIKMNKYYILIYNLYLRSYNINSAIQYYEKYAKCMKKMHSTSSEYDKYSKNIDKVLEGLKSASEELKKKHNFVKGKEGMKKVFDELINKYAQKVGFETKSIGNKQLDQNELLLFEYMLKNGLMKPSDLLNYNPNLIPEKEVNVNNKQQKEIETKPDSKQ